MREALCETGRCCEGGISENWSVVSEHRFREVSASRRQWEERELMTLNIARSETDGAHVVRWCVWNT